MTWLAVAVGGAMGSILRHGVNVLGAQWMGRATPWSTFVVNIVGSFVIGLLAGLIAASRLTMTPTARTFVFVGIIGGFTTFSAYMLDTLTLVEGGHVGKALLNVTAQVGLGYALAFAGYRLGL